ncbi:unnamed protein product [Sphagnum troendelagicum]|uniref:Protein kinase domain-containing protein n=1 Tax=Sphagnum troendelagicum TaxID=128251 RepID=A0ABP0TS96_9BRYO
MADAHVCSSSGLDKGPNGAGQVTNFVSATRSFRNRELQNDATTRGTVMERMTGDLRTCIDSRMRYLEDGQMPFDSNQTISMMMDIAQGMEDLHRCDLIHADLKASNILVYPVLMEREGEKLDGSQEAALSVIFQAKIGDFDTSDGVVECAQSDYDVVLSGRRPELPAYVNPRMKELLSACWRSEPRERPGWTWIIETLKEELMLHPLFASKLVGQISVQNCMLAEIYPKIHKAPLESTTMESIKAWKAVEMEKVAIRNLFLENTIDISAHGYL